MPSVMSEYKRRVAMPGKGRINCTGVTFEHWSDRDTDGDERISRVWHKVGAMLMPCPARMREIAMSKPWRWQVTLMVRLQGGAIERVEVTFNQALRIEELDGPMRSYRDELLAEWPDRLADGWRAVIVGAPI